MKLRAFLFSILVCPLLVPAEPVLRELGVPVRAVNWVRLHPGRGPDGKASLLASMGQNNGGLFVLDIDLATGHCRQFGAPAKAQQYPTAAFRSPQTGILYVGTHTDGHLLRYDPAHSDRGLEDLGPIDGDHATFPTGITESYDGMIWIGGYPDASFTRFNPKTGEFTRFGKMDDLDKYLYPLCGADGTVAAVTKVVHPHVIVLDPATGEHYSVGTPISPDDKSQHLTFFKGLDGLLYLDTHAGNFRLAHGKLEPVTYLPPPMPGIHATYKHAYQEILTMPDSLVASWVDGDETGGGGVFRKVRIASTSAAIAPRVLNLDWTGGGTNIFVTHLGPDGMLYGSSFLPEHFFRCAPDGSGMINFGRCSESLGEAYTMGNFSDGRMIIASYPEARLSLYDPMKPYRYGTDSDANPRDIGRLDRVGIRPISMTVVPALKTAEGKTVPERVWIASLPDYGIWGGTLAWYEPHTGANASHRHIVQDATPFSLAWLPGSKELLVGIATEGGTGTQPKVTHGSFVLWDAVNDRANYTGDFGIKDLPDPVVLAPANDGNVYGLLRTTKTGPGGDVKSFRLVLLDPKQRTVIVDKPFPAELGQVGESIQWALFRGPEGEVYGATRQTLYRLKPGTCDVEVVFRMPEGDHFDNPGPWIGRTLYFSTGWRLRSLTLDAAPANPR